MHIVTRILKTIEPTLKTEYGIYIPHKYWEPFQDPLTNNKGLIDTQKFNIRQKRSIEIINIILERHGKGSILGFLAELATLEPKIQELQPWVRDHIVHAINTFILGVYILKKVKFPKNIPSRYGYPFMWKLCAPTHDLGYPLEIARNIKSGFIKKMNEVLNNIGPASPRIASEVFPRNLDELCNRRNGSNCIQARLKEWSINIDVRSYYEWLRDKNRTDHGVISALAELKVIDALYQESNPSRKQEDVRFRHLNFNELNFTQDIISLCSAIFLHNIDPNFKEMSDKINFHIAPLAFLLILCDTFQEWDRYSKNRPVYSGDDFNLNCKANSISLIVPIELERKITAVLSKKLIGLKISINDKLVVE